MHFVDFFFPAIVGYDRIHMEQGNNVRDCQTNNTADYINIAIL